MKYIFLLKAINVGGHRKILMADLKKIYEQLGFTAVRTYIQSGNVVCEGGAVKGEEAAQRIETAILARYGFEVPVVVRTKAELENALAQNPYAKDENIDLDKVAIMFLEAPPLPHTMSAFEMGKYAPDSFALVGREIYVHCPSGFGETKLTNTLLEKKLGVVGTGRNRKTVAKLIEMAQV
jgi:uncharacterized protein (DUF1697 family)